MGDLEVPSSSTEQNDDEHENKQVEPVSTPSSQKSSEPRTNKQNVKYLIGGFLAAAIIFAGLYFTLFNSSENAATKDQSTTQSQNADNATNPATQPKVVMLDKIVYAHPPTEGSELSGFTRPAAGGDKLDLGWKIASADTVANRDQQAYIVIDRTTGNNKVLYSNDVKEPTQIFTTTDEIVSAILDETNKSALVSTVSPLSAPNQKSTLHIVSITSNTSTVYVEKNFSEFGVFQPAFWDASTKTIYSRTSCYWCDGFNADLYSISATGTQTLVYDAGGYSSTGSNFHFNKSGSTLLLTKGSNYSAAEKTKYGIVEGIGEPVGAPFQLMTIDVASGKATTVTSIGSIKDVNSNGFYTYPTISWVTINGKERISYAYKSKIFVQNLNAVLFTNFYETGLGNIQSIYYVSDKEVVVGVANTNGETISYYNLDTKKAITVMETLFTTQILSLTTN